MWGSRAALMAAALLVLLVSPALLMLLLSPVASDTYEQETRRMFVQWKAKYKITYKYAGEEECRYALFKDSRRYVARENAAGVPIGLNGLSAHANEEIFRGYKVQMGEGSYEEETRRMFVGWKAKYDKTYRDVGEEECRYMLFKENRRIVVKLNAAAAGKTAYGLNQFGDLTNEEVRECCDGRGGEIEGELSAMCQAAAAGYSIYDRLISSQILSVDAIDMSGKHEVDLHTNIWKEYGHIIVIDYLSDLVEKEHGAHHDHAVFIHGHEHHDEQKKQEHTFNEDAEKMVECQKHWRMVKGVESMGC
ncbi:hypothetical protein ACP70R_044068 [Stipagrostis hirtigluma subsp. patula]